MSINTMPIDISYYIRAVQYINKELKSVFYIKKCKVLLRFRFVCLFKQSSSLLLEDMVSFS